MTKKQRYKNILAWFEENRPIAETELMYEDAFGLLVAVILSAQCTDKRVNMTTPQLLHDFPTPEAMAASSPEVIFKYIKSISYPNNKAKHLVGMAQKLVSAEITGCRSENSQCDSFSGVRCTCNGRRYACFPGF